MDLIALKALIDSEPANASKTDADVLAWLNEVDPSAPHRDVEWEEFMIWLGGNDGLHRLQETIDDPLKPDDERGGARLALVILNAGQKLNLSDSRVRGLLAKVAGAGRTFTAAERNELVALAAPNQTRFEVANIRSRGPVGIAHVQQARAL